MNTLLDYMFRIEAARRAEAALRAFDTSEPSEDDADTHAFEWNDLTQKARRAHEALINGIADDREILLGLIAESYPCKHLNLDHNSECWDCFPMGS